VCRYKEQVPLPPIQKKILYLDQFFLSHAFRGAEELFVEAAERIMELASQQVLSVPYSSIHEDETHQWERYADLLDFIKSTSRGHEFSPAYDVESIQLEKAFEAWLASKPAAYIRENRDAFDDDIHIWESYFRIEVGRYLGDVELIRDSKEKSVEGLVGLFKEWRQSATSFEDDVLSEHKGAVNGYWQMFGHYQKRLAQGDLNALIDSPVKSMIVKRLFNRFPDDVPEDQRLGKVAEFLTSEHFRQTPYQDLSSRIFAGLKAMVKEGAYTNRQNALKNLSGFFFDVQHIATYAPYCDAIIVDKPMGHLVARQDVAISNRYDVRVFSRNNWDEMLSWFDELEASITLEHKQALANAYPGVLR